MLARIQFDEAEERVVLRAARWMLLAGAASALLGIAPFTEEPLESADVVIGVALFVIGASLGVAGWSLRRVVKTDGRDQVELARAMWHLRNALIVKGVGVIIYVAVMVLGVLGMGALGVLGAVS
jgi:NhaP-type Na+/H+ and K+/H+ antiporter